MGLPKARNSSDDLDPTAEEIQMLVDCHEKEVKSLKSAEPK